MSEKIKELNFGLCNLCERGIPGHIVRINGYLLCLFCELDIAVPKESIKLQIKEFRIPTQLKGILGDEVSTLQEEY